MSKTDLERLAMRFLENPVPIGLLNWRKDE
jgi:hypothetical protein